MTNDEYIARVKACRCVICVHRLLAPVYPGCEAHHVGTADDRLDFATAALCTEHHRGATGVHGMHKRAFHSFWKTSDIILLGWTAKELTR